MKKDYAWYLESFPTIDQCVEYLVSIGCKWDAAKEAKLVKNKMFEFVNHEQEVRTAVFYDKYGLLDFKG